VAAGYLKRQRPTLLYLSGPPAYMEHEIGAAAIDRGIAHLLDVIESTGCRVILDHHALRGRDWAERLQRLLETGRVVTAAGHLGLRDGCLEIHRPALWARARKPGARAGEARAKIARRAPLGAANTYIEGGHGT
jgi:predicted metallo-beta-lactamase superfamily hydrolase